MEIILHAQGRGMEEFSSPCGPVLNGPMFPQQNSFLGAKCDMTLWADCPELVLVLVRQQFVHTPSAGQLVWGMGVGPGLGAMRARNQEETGMGWREA